MGFIVSKHPKGILITEQGGENRRLSTIKLRSILGVPVSPLSQGYHLVPTNYAYAILEYLGTKEAEWDPELLELALKQSTRREAQIRAQVEVEYAIENAEQELSNYALARKLDRHQLEAVAAISTPSLQGLAIFDEQGTGKTIMALCGFDRLRRQEKVDRLIVIAPKSVLGSWKNDAEMLFGENYKIQIVSGTAKIRRKQLLAKHDILAISYDTAVRERSLLKTLLSTKASKYMLVADETYYVKNPEAQRTKLVSEIRFLCERAIILCGTPAPNSPHDVIQQINIADEGLTFENSDIPKDVEEAYPIIEKTIKNAIFLRRLKQDVLPDIPKKEINRITFELQPIQRDLYDRVREETILILQSIDDQQFTKQLTSFLARRLMLIQICSHPGYIDPHYVEVPAKQLVLDQLLKDLIDNKNKKIVIWSYFRYSLEALANRYARYGMARIDGSVSNVDDRIDAIRRFQSDPQIRVFLGNPAAAGAGVTLTAAHHAVYESFSNQAAHYMQSVDRIHRRGQEHVTTYHVLLPQDTIEEKEFERILAKEQLGRNLLGDKYEEPITRERFLTELGALAN
jgi:SNF2 family DNA or RNA helicase